MGFVFDAPETPSLTIEGSEDRFAVRRIYCVGRNYAAHAREMGRDPDREKPFYFMKPADAIVDGGGDIPYPPSSENFHYEGELVIAIGKSGSDISEADALDYVYGYAVGNDLTRRDLQLDAREKGRPWDTGKGFDNSAPCSAIRRASEIGHPENATIWLKVNGETKQNSDINKLIWSVPEVIANLSSLYTLEPGDIIYTGTPEGVGPIVKGDKVVCGVEGVGELAVTIV